MNQQQKEASFGRSRLQQIFRVLLGLFMTYAGIGRLGERGQEFRAVVPRWLTQDVAVMDAIVLASGIIEIAMGLALVFWFRKRVNLGLFYAFFFVLVFTGNLSQYTNHIDAFGLDSDFKRMLRLFFQPLFILWALWSTGAGAFLLHKFYKKK